MARSKRNAANRQALSGQPDWAVIQPDMTPIRGKGYDRLFWEATFYIHYEVKYASRAKSFIRYIEREKGKPAARNLALLPDSDFISIGKITYCAMKGTGLNDEHKASIERAYERLSAKAEKIRIVRQAETRAKAAQAKAKGEAPKLTIQQRMLEQIETLGGNIEEQIDNWMRGTLKVADFDPFAMIEGYSPEVKAPQAKILRSFFERQLAEARLIVEFKDPDIKEAYADMPARKRKEYLQLIEKVVNACDAITESKKAQRKPRAKKAPDKAKQVSKLKFKTNDPDLGIASINPLEILGASAVWVYDTKTRKLGVYYAAADTGGLGVKGASIVGFDEATSLAKTVRKPAEQLKGVAKLARTKIVKLHDALTTTPTKLKGRLNDNVIIVRAFK